MKTESKFTREEKLQAAADFMEYDWKDSVDSILVEKVWHPGIFDELDTVTARWYLLDRLPDVTVGDWDDWEELGRDFVDSLTEQEWGQLESRAYDGLLAGRYETAWWLEHEVLLDSFYLINYLPINTREECRNFVDVFKRSLKKHVIEEAEKILKETASKNGVCIGDVQTEDLSGSLGIEDSYAEQLILGAVQVVLESEEDCDDEQ